MPFFYGGSPTKVDYRQKSGTLILTSKTGGPSHSCHCVFVSLTESYKHYSELLKGNPQDLNKLTRLDRRHIFLYLYIVLGRFVDTTASLLFLASIS